MPITCTDSCKTYDNEAHFINNDPPGPAGGTGRARLQQLHTERDQGCGGPATRSSHTAACAH